MPLSPQAPPLLKVFPTTLDYYFLPNFSALSVLSVPINLLSNSLCISQPISYFVVQSPSRVWLFVDCSAPSLPIPTISPSLPKFMSIESWMMPWVMPSNHLILCHPFLLLLSIFLSIMVFSYESALPIRWPTYWSFSFSVSSSSDYSVLISFRIDWLDLLVF